MIKPALYNLCLWMGAVAVPDVQAASSLSLYCGCLGLYPITLLYVKASKCGFIWPPPRGNLQLQIVGPYAKRENHSGSHRPLTTVHRSQGFVLYMR